MPYLDCCVQYNNNNGKTERTTLFGVKRQWRAGCRVLGPGMQLAALYITRRLLLKYIKSPFAI